MARKSIKADSLPKPDEIWSSIGDLIFAAAEYEFSYEGLGKSLTEGFRFNQMETSYIWRLKSFIKTQTKIRDAEEKVISPLERALIRQVFKTLQNLYRAQSEPEVQIEFLTRVFTPVFGDFPFSKITVNKSKNRNTKKAIPDSVAIKNTLLLFQHKFGKNKSRDSHKTFARIIKANASTLYNLTNAEQIRLASMLREIVLGKLSADPSSGKLVKLLDEKFEEILLKLDSKAALARRKNKKIPRNQETEFLRPRIHGDQTLVAAPETRSFLRNKNGSTIHDNGLRQVTTKNG